MTRKPLPTNYLRNAGTAVSLFSSLGEWNLRAAGSGSTGTPSLVSNTEQFYAGGHGIQFVQGDNTPGSAFQVMAYKYNAGGWDLSGTTQVQVWIYYPDTPLRETTLDGDNEFFVTFSSDAEHTYTNFIGWTVGDSVETGRARKGIMVFTLDLDDANLSGGTIDWSAVTNCRVHVKTKCDANYTQPDNPTFGAIYVNRTARTKVVITMDDGDATQNDAVVYANGVGIPCTLYVIPSEIDGAGNLTSAQLDSLHAAGNNLCVHGNAEFVSDSDHGLAQMENNRDWLRARGYLRGSTHVAYVGGRYNDDVISATQAAGMDTGRTILGVTYYPGPPIREASMQLTSIEPTALGVGNLYSLSALNLNNSTSLAEAKAHVDLAIKRGTTAFFYSHKFDSVADALTWTTSDWEALCDYIESLQTDGLIDAVSISDWFLGLSKARRTQI